MGKYMRKGKSVDKMPVLEGALGVRTRARALALQKQASKPDSAQAKHTTTESLKKLSAAAGISTDCLTKSVVPAVEPQSEEHYYMELRSRRLGRVSSKASIARPRNEVTVARHSLLKNSISRRSISDDESSRVRLSPNACAQVNRCRTVPFRSEASEVQSSAIDAGSAHCRRVTPSASTSNSVCMPERPPLGVHTTRHWKQAFECLNGEDMDVDEEVTLTRRKEHSPAAADTNAHSTEVEQFCGENAVMIGPSSAERHKRGARESTPDSYFRSIDAPGSTTRSRHAHRGQSRSLSAPPFNRANEAPSSSEIEAFFQGVEQQERRKFIERYNFDPANERPLRGRYEWMSL